MTRAVYVGGFGNGMRSAERVAEALVHFGYDQVDPITFSSAMDNPDQLRRAVRGVAVFSHSAGMVSLRGTSPTEIHAFGAPLPARPARLLTRIAWKTIRMHVPGCGAVSARDAGLVADYDIGSVAEGLENPASSLRHARRVPSFNAVNAAIAAQRAGISTTLAYNQGDELFQLPSAEALRAQHAGVGVVRLSGIHDELVLRPAETLAEYGLNPR